VPWSPVRWPARAPVARRPGRTCNPTVAPVGPVSVLDAQRHWRAGRFARDYPTEDLGAILLDRHPLAAAVPALTSFQLAVDRLDIHCKACGEALHNRDQKGTVGFAGGQES